MGSPVAVADTGHSVATQEQIRVYQKPHPKTGVPVRYTEMVGGSDGVRIARRALQAGEPVEKIVNQLAFLRCHGFSPSLASKRGGDVGGLYVASSVRTD